MKKILFVVTLILYVINTKAQVGTDLQFSQIISLSGEFSTNVSNNSTYHMIGQVPAGKIWKITYSNAFNNQSYNCANMASNNYATSTPAIQERKVGIYVKKDFLPSGSGYVEIDVSNPPDPTVYFNENDQLYVKLHATSGSSGGCNRYVFQAIEYTVIP